MIDFNDVQEEPSKVDSLRLLKTYHSSISRVTLHTAGMVVNVINTTSYKLKGKRFGAKCEFGANEHLPYLPE
eukprot:scaffold8763_cov133-Skeletonema_menzelii.AAC.2